MRVLFVFIDGFGIGEDVELCDGRICLHTGYASRNPIASAKTPALEIISREHIIIPTDTCLGVPGLPQSATGQTAIFTGVNGAEVLGRHLNGQPTKTLVDIINKHGLFKELINRGYKPSNSNVYRDEYLQNMLNPKDRRNRPSVSSVMNLSAGMRFRTVDDFRQGNGLYHDITGKILLESGYDVDAITPEAAGERFVAVSREYDFTLFEYFMTDIKGHKQDMEACVKIVEEIDRFLGRILEKMDPGEDLLMVASDHGNLEDISVKTHTYNKVPTILAGKGAERVKDDIRSLLDIYPAIFKLLKK
jgi:hypothetical protein